MSEGNKYWCCPECGCTDVQVLVWAHANTDEILDSCDSYNWCPQCEGDTGDGENKYLRDTTTLQPLRGPRVMVIEDLMGDDEHTADDYRRSVWFDESDAIERAYRSAQE